MLHPQNNRIDYGAQLAPPKEGYSLDYAVGTSYSLDLEALLIIPIALFYSKPLDTTSEQLRYDMLEAITKASKQITVYCQKGKIKVPNKYHRLMEYWGDAVEEIQMDSFVASFHPKIWVARYVSPEKPAIYRLIVTSRNLTFARDWDIGFSTEGFVGEAEQPKNIPLANFLRYLSAKGKRKIPEVFIKELMQAEFSVPAGFNLLNLFPIGFSQDGSEYKNPLEKKEWARLVVISPFLDKTTLSTLAAKADRISIFSRKETLDEIPVDAIQEIGEDRFFRFSDSLCAGEYLEESESSQDPMPQNLHAKIFIGEKNGAYYWYAGSANATDPAFGRNVEFLVGLKTYERKYGPKKIKKLLIEPEDKQVALFDPYIVGDRPESPKDGKSEQQLRKLIYDICQLPIAGEAVLVQDTALYNLVLNVDAKKINIPKGFSVRIKPLPEVSRQGCVIKARIENILSDFTGYTETQLSPFIQIDISSADLNKRFIVKMDMVLPATRLDKIFRSVIDNKEKFLRYLAFLLSGVETGFIGHGGGKKKGGAESDGNAAGLESISIFENMLISASQHPEKLKDIDALITRLQKESASSESVISPDFLKLWQVFRKYLEQNNAEQN